MIDFKIKSITFSGNDTIELESNSLLIIIGPNNSGKTTALTNIEEAARSNDTNNLLVIKNLELEKNGTIEDLREWFQQNYPIIEMNGDKSYFTKGTSIEDNRLERAWGNQFNVAWERNIRNIFGFLCHRLNTEDRLRIANTKHSSALFKENASEYIHILQSDDNLLKKISKEVRNAFEKDIIINWSGGESVWFHVGDEPERSKEHDRVSPKYLKELNSLPKLDKEGDGIKSFVGCILGIYCGAQKILSIDEPEAFLHPPQSRKLGYLLARSANELSRQIIIATHSGDIIKGAINSGEKVSVCRIERTHDNKNKAFLLKSDYLKELWSKPLLQSTSAINGIFHSGVVVCEADADCRFYESLVMNVENKNLFNKPTDLYFIHGGGKGEISTLIKSYKSLNVKTVAISDFDLLRNENELKKIIETLDGSWQKIDSIYSSAKSALDDLPSIKTIPAFLDEMKRNLSNIEEKKEISISDKESISNLLSNSSKWSEAKKYGIEKLTGGAHKSCQDLLSYCKNIGLFIIPNGELESFWRGGPSNKNDWIISALEKIQQEPNSFKEAESFIVEVCSYFGIETINNNYPRL